MLKLVFPILFLFLSDSACCTQPTLRVLIEEGSLSEKTINDFQELTNSKVRVDFYKKPQERDGLLVSGSGSGFDVTLVEHSALSGYQRVGWINFDINTEELMFGKWTEGVVGMLIKNDLVETISSWKDFYELCFAIPHKVSLIDSSVININLALKSLHLPTNEINKANLDKVKTGYFNECDYQVTSSRFSHVVTQLEKNYLVAMMVYNQDARKYLDATDGFTYVLPEEGTIKWSKFHVVLEKSNNKILANMFIHYLERVDVRMDNYNQLGLAVSLKDHEHKHIIDNIIYPDRYKGSLSCVHFNSSEMVKIYSDLHSTLAQ